MNTSSTCRSHGSSYVGKGTRGPAPAAVAILAAVAALLPGCGYAGGEMAYMLGLGRAKKVEARFRLSDGPVLVLVDDPKHRVSWPPAKAILVDEVTDELLRTESTLRIVPRATLDNLRLNDPDLAQRGCRELGQLAGAEQVLWVEIDDFNAPQQIEDASDAAFVNVRIKVIDSRKDDAAPRPRLWPTSPRGHNVGVALDGATVVRLKTQRAVCQELAKQLAEQVARLFHDYRPSDFEAE